jgi:hypothetical protein
MTARHTANARTVTLNRSIVGASSDRHRRTRYILEQGDRVARNSREPLHGGVQGGQPLPGHAVMVTAEQQVGRMRPGRGRWHHDPHHWHGRAAAGRAGDALIGPLTIVGRVLAGLTRKRCVHALRVPRPGPGQQRRTSLVLRTKVPRRPGGSGPVTPEPEPLCSVSEVFNLRPAFPASRWQRRVEIRWVYVNNLRRPEKGRRGRAVPDSGGPDSYGQFGPEQFTCVPAVFHARNG